MGLAQSFRKLCQALLFPQACVVCRDWVVNSDFSPLCSRCLGSLPPLKGPICYYCGLPLPANLLQIHSVCSSCRSGIQPFEFARSYGIYQADLRFLIGQYKFRGQRRLASPLAQLLEQCYRGSGLGIRPSWIIPVPLHRRRRKERGFDQTLLLSQFFARGLGIPIFSGLHRAKSTLAQSGLELSERRRNLKDAFKLEHAQLVLGQKVLVVDDVMTTGTTVSEVCSLLRQKGRVETILVLTLARVLRWCRT